MKGACTIQDFKPSCSSMLQESCSLLSLVSTDTVSGKSSVNSLFESGESSFLTLASLLIDDPGSASVN